MSDLIGQKVIFAVAQVPFETQGDIMHMFGTLAPVVMSDGEVCEDGDFPNSGLVWWMLRPGIRSLATPGRLLKGTLQEAIRYDPADISSKYYQVDKDTISAIDPEDAVEVLTVDDDIGREPHHLVGHQVVTQLNRPAASVVLVRWRGRVLGPFRAASQGEGVIYEIRLAPLRPDQAVVSLPEEEFSPLVAAGRLHRHVSVTLEQVDRLRAESQLRCTYELLMGDAYRRFSRCEHSRLRLETDLDVIKRLSRRLLSRREKQAAIDLLSKLEALAQAGADETTMAEARLLEAVRRQASDELSETTALAAAVLGSGLLEDRLSTALDSTASAYVQDNVERLNAEVQQKVQEDAKKLEALRAQAAELQGTLEAKQRRAHDELQRELAERRQQFLLEIEAERSHINSEREQQQQIRSLVDDTLRQLKEERGQVLGAVLTTLSLLGEERPRATSPTSDTVAPPVSAPLQVPAYVASEPGPGLANEVDFFERFCQHVERKGFRYRPVDLASFHLSVKCGDITILGGSSGIGKSSLPRLYDEALAGDDGIPGRYLEVAVSPAWLDMRDLLGYVNTLDRRFQPSESGLFAHLAWAQEEYERKGPESGLVLVNLDEMNLSQVEHYFSGFLQAVERPMESRLVSCFSPETVDAQEPFLRWARLNLPPSLRFMGTVNMDETTKPLSLRLLDRANFIRLRPYSGLIAKMDIDETVRPSGPEVLLRNYRSWIRAPQLPPALAELLDEVKKALGLIGTTISPRRQRGIATFVASAPQEFCPPEMAFDLQVAQRIVPHLRGTVTEDSGDGLSALLALFERRELTFPESTRALRELVDRISDGPSFVRN